MSRQQTECVCALCGKSFGSDLDRRDHELNNCLKMRGVVKGGSGHRVTPKQDLDQLDHYGKWPTK